MKLFSFILLLNCSLQKVHACNISSDDSIKVFTFVEEPPEYKGNPDSMQKLMQENIRYSSLNLPAGFKGKVIIRFVIDPYGNVIKPEVTKGLTITKQINNHYETISEPDKSLSTACENEALRVTRLFHFYPGKQKGKQVYVYFNMPVLFKTS